MAKLLCTEKICRDILQAEGHAGKYKEAQSLSFGYKNITLFYWTRQQSTQAHSNNSYLPEPLNVYWITLFDRTARTLNLLRPFELTTYFNINLEKQYNFVE